MTVDGARRFAISADVYSGPHGDGGSYVSGAAGTRTRLPSFDLDPDLDGLSDDRRRREELVEAGALTGELLGELTGLVHGVHAAIARRVFRYVGPPAAPVEIAHSAIADRIYGALRSGGNGFAKIAGHALGRRDRPAPAASTVGGIVLRAVNGVLGSEREERSSPLAVRMSLRAHGEEVAPTRGGLRAAYPDATPRLVVFVHGLCETEDAWRLHAGQHHGDPTSTHGSRLRRDLGYSPVYLRYNTGRHVSDNGRQF